MERPEPTYEAPEGWHFEVVIDKDWRLVETDKKCRMMTRYKSCKQPAVAELNRSHHQYQQRWWAYCPDHLYGRWVENGHVMMWRLVRNEQQASA
jgi:hypothetical protein